MGKTGRVVEALDNKQYHVRVDGSHWVTQHNPHFHQKINLVIDSPYYPQPEGTSETLEIAKALTISRLQHAELQPTHYQLEASDIVPMEVEEVESHEDKDNVTAMEVDEDQNQPPSNQASHQSVRVSRPPRDLSSPWLHGVSHKLSEHPSYTTTTRMSCCLIRRGACEGMEEH